MCKVHTPDMIFFLLLQIRQNDRLAVSKLVTSLTKGSVRSPLAQCLLIRYTSQVPSFPPHFPSVLVLM